MKRRFQVIEKGKELSALRETFTDGRFFVRDNEMNVIVHVGSLRTCRHYASYHNGTEKPNIIPESELKA